MLLIVSIAWTSPYFFFYININLLFAVVTEGEVFITYPSHCCRALNYVNVHT